jgi:hypothetical protein
MGYFNNKVDVDVLLGKTLRSISGVDESDIIFTTSEGERYRMYHDQDCCEGVRIEDIDGDINDLVGTPLLQAEEVSDYDGGELDEDSYTWTFYKFATIKGYVTLRWLGVSNGYYSEGVDFEKLPYEEF